jgi:hypothetical protein
MKRLLAVVLLVGALLSLVTPSYAGVPGKSAFQGTVFFVSGASDNALTLNYRATESWSLLLTGEWASVGSASLSVLGAGARYYFAPTTAYDPYIFGTVGSVTLRVPRGSVSASVSQFGVGASKVVSESITLKGAVGWTSLLGQSAFGYDVALNYDFTPGKYAAVGLNGGSGGSTMYLGVGLRF